MMCGVVGDGAENGCPWRATHDRARRQRLAPLFIGVGIDDLFRVLDRSGQSGACLG